MKSYLIVILAFIQSIQIFGQGKAPENWYLNDPKSSKIYGTGANEAYRLLTGKKSIPVIVAVIDSGVEVDHPDLKDVIWVNSDEIPNNGVDDDRNGYIDDVHGWSFLGGKTEDIGDEALELKRMVFLDKKYFQGKKESALSASDKERYVKHQDMLKKWEAEIAETNMQYQNVKVLYDYIENVKSKSKGVFSKSTNKSYKPQSEIETKIKSRMKLIFLQISPKDLDREISGAATSMQGQIKMNYIDSDSLRAVIVGDNPNDLSERFYGCNRYEGPDAMHGTHVSGIIAAKRGNGIGIDGIADNAQIMVLRAVPNGDERDKDVANAIRYAVDNGAKVINMSFGKYYTPHKTMVDEAVQYALERDVLLIHAAGNEAKNKDLEDSYPTRKANNGKVFPNWIEVGASSSESGKNLIANFSNYGATTVDFFAPGVDIYSTVPNAAYEDASGTSMACPATAGVAALIRSYFPNLTAIEVREALMNSVVPLDGNIQIPGTKEEGTMKNLSISGGFVNAASAVTYILNKK